MSIQHSQIFQITSIEPVQPILPLVTESALRHELSVEIAEPVSFSAPFCGGEYFAQQVRVLSKSNDSSLTRFNECFDEIQTIVEQQLADGYVETRQS